MASRVIKVKIIAEFEATVTMTDKQILKALSSVHEQVGETIANTLPYEKPLANHSNIMTQASFEEKGK
jgi:hypothetical protein